MLNSRIAETLLGLIFFTSINVYAIDEDCRKVFSVASSAISNKEKGISKYKLKAALPSLSLAPTKEPLRSMHEIVDEVYDYEVVDKFIYSTYRTEICYLRKQGKSIPKVDYKLTLEKLKKCQTLEADDHAICAMKAVVSGKNT